MKNPGRLLSSLRGFFLSAVCCGGLLSAAATPEATALPIRFALVIGSWIRMPIGKYNHAHRWVRGDAYYAPFQPAEFVTVFDVGGKKGVERILSPRRPDPSGFPLEWKAPIERWMPSPDGEGYAIAVQGVRPEGPPAPHAIPLTDPECLRIARETLAQRGLHIETPILTQALKLNLNADGTDYLLFVSALSDRKALDHMTTESWYALSLMHRHVAGQDQTYTLAAQTSYKPAGRTRLQQEHFYGTPAKSRFLAFADLDGDGKAEIALYTRTTSTIMVDVFTYEGKTPKKVISIEKPTDLY
jgi:hypothetical protein